MTKPPGRINRSGGSTSNRILERSPRKRITRRGVSSHSGARRLAQSRQPCRGLAARDGVSIRAVFVERPTRPRVVIVIDVPEQDAPQIALVDHDCMALMNEAQRRAGIGGDGRSRTYDTARKPVELFEESQTPGTLKARETPTSGMQVPTTYSRPNTF